MALTQAQQDAQLALRILQAPSLINAAESVDGGRVTMAGANRQMRNAQSILNANGGAEGAALKAKQLLSNPETKAAYDQMVAQIDAQNKSGGLLTKLGDAVVAAAPTALMAAVAAGAGDLLSLASGGGGLFGGSAGTAGGAGGAAGGALPADVAAAMEIPAGTVSSLGGVGSGVTAADVAAAMQIPAGTLSTLGGAGAAAGAAGAAGGGGGFLDAITNATGLSSNTLGSLVSGGASLLAGNMGANAAGDAMAESARQFNVSQANLQPWLQAGTKALGAQQDLLGLGANGPEAQLSALMSAPGYQFRKTQGEKALAASTAARGGMGSGKALTGAMQYGQDYASNEYNNRLNQLAGVSGTGQTTGYNLANLGQQYGSEAGNAAIAAANARQSGILGAGQALSGWLNPVPQQTNTLASLIGQNRQWV